jgi:hypothetical protein
LRQRALDKLTDEEKVALGIRNKIMSKKLVLSTQCRRCLKPLTYVEVESSICKNCGEQKRKHSGAALYCNIIVKFHQDTYFTPVMVKKLLNRDYCEGCLEKDEKKKNRIKRAQRKIGIKATRKKKTEWKDKKPVEMKPNEQLPAFYLKRRAGVIYTKYSPKERWKKTSVQKLAHLERNYLCRGNPDNEAAIL